ncbi:hypothetical protein AURDEDRAFT_124296 [Auricularia subglabra TFB-10046 SS5]|nr:hypothetical protein AURDEDRAFT_124296 [Auricularia subglabra TFB-10046 SS5]
MTGSTPVPTPNHCQGITINTEIVDDSQCLRRQEDIVMKIHSDIASSGGNTSGGWTGWRGGAGPPLGGHDGQSGRPLPTHRKVAARQPARSSPWTTDILRSMRSFSPPPDPLESAKARPPTVATGRIMDDWQQAQQTAAPAQTPWHTSRNVEELPPEAGWLGTGWTGQGEQPPAYETMADGEASFSATGYAPRDALFTAHLVEGGEPDANARENTAKELRRPTWDQQEHVPATRRAAEVGPPLQRWGNEVLYTTRQWPVPTPEAHTGGVPATPDVTGAAALSLPQWQGGLGHRPLCSHSVWTPPGQGERALADTHGVRAGGGMSAPRSKNQATVVPPALRTLPRGSRAEGREQHDTTGGQTWPWPNADVPREWHNGAEVGKQLLQPAQGQQLTPLPGGRQQVESWTGDTPTQVPRTERSGVGGNVCDGVVDDGRNGDRTAESTPPAAFLRDTSRRTHWKVHHNCAEKHDEAIKGMLDEPAYHAVSARGNEGKSFPNRRRYMYSTRMHPAPPRG